MRRIVTLIILLLYCFSFAVKAETINGVPDNLNLNDVLLIELEGGVVVIRMFPEVAPWHVFRIKLLVAEGFYNGLTFHRVIRNFMAQTGDPTGKGTGGSRYGNIQAEISDLKHQRGTVSMARANDLDSANSQFFIVTAKDNVEHLDGQYTIWGQVLQGMYLIDNLKSSTALDNNGLVKNPDKIVKMRLGQEMNYNYEEDTEEEKEQRRKERIGILQNLPEFKKLYDTFDSERKANASLLDEIFKLNEEL
ncbi:MAG: peptidylprolyl isomerase [Rickettsiales bacterium]|jgi:peptidylprolyl isomerase|nr:peptidylprolyl isomerase [Rickettsiales bacterium]